MRAGSTTSPQCLLMGWTVLPESMPIEAKCAEMVSMSCFSGCRGRVLHTIPAGEQQRGSERVN